jgi:hypothetical protein
MTVVAGVLLARVAMVIRRRVNEGLQDCLGMSLPPHPVRSLKVVLPSHAPFSPIPPLQEWRTTMLARNNLRKLADATQARTLVRGRARAARNLLANLNKNFKWEWAPVG